MNIMNMNKYAILKIPIIRPSLSRFKVKPQIPYDLINMRHPIQLGIYDRSAAFSLFL